MNVIYGPNEAGKSTALCALEGLCFGIEKRSSDGYFHWNDQLRVGAAFLRTDGTQATFFRKNGRKNTLRGPDDSVIDDSLILPYLCGVGRAGFEALFCLSYQRLSEGGKNILEENGEIGRLLFEARSDVSLQSVIDKLSKRADELFKGTPRANAIIDKALGEYDTQRKLLKRGDIQAYKKVQDELDQLRESSKKLENSRQNATNEFTRLSRYLAAFPQVRRLKRAESRLAELGELPRLALNFQSRFAEATSLETKSADQKRVVLTNIESLENRLKGIEVNSSIIAWREEIDRLNQQVQQIKNHFRDKPSEQKKVDDGFLRAQIALSRFRPGEVPDEKNLADDFELTQIADLIRDKETIEKKLENLLDGIGKIESDLEAAKNSLQSLKVVEINPELVRALNEAKSFEKIAQTLPSRVIQLDLREQELLSEAQRLGAGHLSAKEFTILVFPSRLLIREYAERFKSLQDRETRDQQDLNGVKRELDNELSQRSALLLAGDIPTEAQLRESRSNRDTLWGKLRHQFSDADPASLTADQAEIFETSIRDSDTVADRLRREADRTATLAAINSKIEFITSRVNVLHDQQDALAVEKNELEADWKSRWPSVGIAIDHPQVMLDWKETFETLVNSVKAFEAESAHLHADQEQVARATQALCQSLGIDQGNSRLVDLIAEADRLIKEANRAQGRLDELNNRLRDGEAKLRIESLELEKIREKETEWKQTWQAQTTCLRISHTPTVTEANAAISAIREAARQLEIARIAEKCVKGMDADVAVFDESVTRIVTAVDPSLAKFTSLAAIENLVQSLEAAQEAANFRKGLTENIDSQREVLLNAERHLLQAQSVIGELCQESNCEDRFALGRLVEALKASEQPLRDSAEARDALAEIALGMPVEKLIGEVDILSQDLIERDREELQNEIEAINAELKLLNQQIGSKDKELTNLDNSTELAEAQIKAEGALSRIRSSIRPYLVAAGGESLLRAQIEAYRKENQAPLLKKASEIFAVLTDGSFSELSADVDDKDDRFLIAIRGSKRTGIQERLGVEALSSATRIALYLSLRLACVYHHVEQREGVPFVADDILLDFDDARSRQVMAELGKLAMHTQVIMFTHHQHLVQIGKDVLGSRCAVASLAR